MLFVVIAHDIESSFCLPTPPHPSPLLSPPRLLASSSSRTFRHTGSTARLENDTILQEDRTLVKTASFVEQGYITSRVSPRALRSRFRERLKSKKKKTKRRESLSFHSLSLFDRRADSRYLRIDNRRGTTVIHTSTGGYATQRVNDELLHLTTV